MFFISKNIIDKKVINAYNKKCFILVVRLLMHLVIQNHCKRTFADKSLFDFLLMRFAPS